MIFRPPREPLDNWEISWDANNQDLDELKPDQWWFFQRDVPEKFLALFNWSYKRRHGQWRDIGKSFDQLYRAKLGIGEDEQWHFSHPLGRGGFGAVAMFEKRDDRSSTITDQIAVKTTKAQRHGLVERNRCDLSMEAVLMAQTNDIGEDGMLKLRNYKYYSELSQWKYYFEYCPHGDLERLRVRYKAYGRWLPELFLWHTFYWLAKTVREYTAHNGWKDATTDNWGDVIPGGFLLHSDIKPQNILLGDPDPDDNDRVNLYPIPRIADLGLASIEAPYDANNEAVNLHRGTPGWHPPEIRWRQMIQQTNFYPFQESAATPMNPDIHGMHRKGRHMITSKANVWAIGAVMFSLTTLKESDQLSSAVDNILQELTPAPGPGESVVDDGAFGTGNIYSQELLDLIKDAIRLVPGDRPDEDDLVQRALAGYKKCLDPLLQAGYTRLRGGPSLENAIETLPHYKVYYRKNEIQDAPDNYQHSHLGINYTWWTNFFLHDWPWLPHEWGLLWPNTMPFNVSPPRNWPDTFKNNLKTISNMLAYSNQQGAGTNQQFPHLGQGYFTTAPLNPLRPSENQVQQQQQQQQPPQPFQHTPHPDHFLPASLQAPLVPQPMVPTPRPQQQRNPAPPFAAFQAHIAQHQAAQVQGQARARILAQMQADARAMVQTTAQINAAAQVQAQAPAPAPDFWAPYRAQQAANDAQAAAHAAAHGQPNPYSFSPVRNEVQGLRLAPGGPLPPRNPTVDGDGAGNGGNVGGLARGAPRATHRPANRNGVGNGGGGDGDGDMGGNIAGPVRTNRRNSRQAPY